MPQRRQHRVRGLSCAYARYLVRKPDAGKLHVRFDARDLETGPALPRQISTLHPGLALRVMPPACPPKFGSEGRRRKSGARRVGVLRDTITACVQSTAPKSGASFRAHLVKTPNPGLKPWAILCCPFGASSDRWPRTCRAVDWQRRKQGHSTASPDRRPHKRGRSNCFST